jgi:hypothetical protein
MFTNLKRRSALLLSLAVVCATVALVPQTSVAAPSNAPADGTLVAYSAPGNTTAYTACPGSSAAAAGFTDTTSTDVDCIKMYGITTGKTATTYEPSATVSRQDMARFIHRMFTPTAVAAAGLTAVPTFTDTAAVTADGLAAINALASHGITTGKTATTFAPDDNVTREEMALFLYRFGQIVGAYDDATPSGLTMGIATQTYNYTDIASTSFEGMEAIIGLYNAGITGETCTSLSLTTCSLTYRPTEDITRAEMASMLNKLLGHTQARPAGVSIQATAAALAGSNSSTISCRGTDFTPTLNCLVDEFYQVRTDTTAATIALSVPFTAIVNTCNSSTGGVATAGGTLCTMTSLDKSTSALGNVAGQPQTLAAGQTGRWWVWTGLQGATYVDGTTVAFAYDLGLSASATATTYAATMKTSFGVHTAASCDFSANAGLTGNDGICTIPGGSRTITTTLAGAAATAVVDGYSVKYVDKKVDYLGNTVNTTTYALSVGGVTSLTITCGADNLNTVAANGAYDASSSFWEAHEVTVSLASLTAPTNGRPVGSSAPTASYPDAYGDHSSTMNISCDDELSTYRTTNVETLAIGDNTITASVAGTLATTTVSAYDQYGTGKSGVTAEFRSNTTPNIGAAGGWLERATLVTGSDGKAALTAVHCASSANSSVQWMIEADQSDLPDTGPTSPNAGVEGTIVYCASAGADGSYADATGGTQTTVITLNDIAANITGGGAKVCLSNVGQAAVVCTATAVSLAAGWITQANDTAAANTAEALIEAMSNTPANTNIASTVVAAKQLLTIVFPANTGVWAVTITDNTLAGGTVAAVAPTIVSTSGVTDTEFKFIDDEPASNELTTLKTELNADAAGAAQTQRTYEVWSYDSGDVFNTAALNGATEAQFETANALIADLTTNVTMSYRTGALTTGVSSIKVG